jgi:uncharacterized OB-fold protein
MWRNRETVTSFIGGKCSKCGTLQFPKTGYLRQPQLRRDRHAGAARLRRHGPGD